MTLLECIAFAAAAALGGFLAGLGAGSRSSRKASGERREQKETLRRVELLGSDHARRLAGIERSLLNIQRRFEAASAPSDATPLAPGPLPGPPATALTGLPADPPELLRIDLDAAVEAGLGGPAEQGVAEAAGGGPRLADPEASAAALPIEVLAERIREGWKRGERPPQLPGLEISSLRFRRAVGGGSRGESTGEFEDCEQVADFLRVRGHDQSDAFAFVHPGAIPNREVVRFLYPDVSLDGDPDSLGELPPVRLRWTGSFWVKA
jgi:hypothetical protein